MDNKQIDEQLAFAVTVKDLQKESVNILGRRLTDEELHTAIKGFEAGLLFDIETVFKTAVEEVVNN
ncbi:MAG: hypothetical protein J7M38_08380 [Armatimonadetes bacterium]|nr:hypothetical protein [Armatimonadota bacterium]